VSTAAQLLNQEHENIGSHQQRVLSVQITSYSVASSDWDCVIHRPPYLRCWLRRANPEVLVWQRFWIASLRSQWPNTEL